MALELLPLRPEHADDYLGFFDRAFADNPAWSGCYCAFYEDPCSDAEWNPGASAGPAASEDPNDGPDGPRGRGNGGQL